MTTAIVNQGAFKCVMVASRLFRRRNPQDQDVASKRASMVLAAIHDEWEDRSEARWRLGKDGCEVMLLPAYCQLSLGMVMVVRQQRIDPEPITIFLAGMAVFSATISSLNYAKTHHRPLSSVTRNRILIDVNKLNNLINELQQDLSTIRNTFDRSGNRHESSIELGNGLYLSYVDFKLYQSVSANIFRVLGKAHGVCLRLEYHAAQHSGLQMREPTNELGSAYEIFEQLMMTKNLSIRDAWDGLEQLSAHVRAACDRIRDQLL